MDQKKPNTFLFLITIFLAKILVWNFQTKLKSTFVHSRIGSTLLQFSSSVHPDFGTVPCDPHISNFSTDSIRKNLTDLVLASIKAIHLSRETLKHFPTNILGFLCWMRWSIVLYEDISNWHTDSALDIQEVPLPLEDVPCTYLLWFVVDLRRKTINFNGKFSQDKRRSGFFLQRKFILATLIFWKSWFFYRRLQDVRRLKNILNQKFV